MANKIAAKKTRRLFGKKGSKADRLKAEGGIVRKESRKRMTDYGERFKAKQDCKRMYGLTEKAFEKYFKMAQKSSGNTEDVLLMLIEKRLDNTVYATGFYKSRAMARQAVSHGHVLVNGKRLNIPSAQTKIGDVITLKPSEKLAKKLEDERKADKKEIVSADHVYFELDKMEAKVLRDPDVTPIKQFVDTRLIVEYYSK